MDRTTRKVRRRPKHPTTRKVEGIDLPWYRRMPLGQIWTALVVSALVLFLCIATAMRCSRQGDASHPALNADHGNGGGDA